MISQMHFFLTPYFRTKFLCEDEIKLLFKKIDSKNLSPSLVFKNKKIERDEKLRKSSSLLFNYRKLEKKLHQTAYQNMKSLDESIPKKHFGAVEILQFASYQKGDFFDWHTDSYTQSKKDKNRTLTMVIALSHPDEYQGGHLELIDYRNNKIKIDNLEKGELIIFPSDYLHRVSPVRSGKRLTITAWLMSGVMTRMHSLKDS